MKVLPRRELLLEVFLPDESREHYEAQCYYKINKQKAKKRSPLFYCIHLNIHVGFTWALLTSLQQLLTRQIQTLVCIVLANCFLWNTLIKFKKEKEKWAQEGSLLNPECQKEGAGFSLSKYKCAVGIHMSYHVRINMRYFAFTTIGSFLRMKDCWLKYSL